MLADTHCHLDFADFNQDRHQVLNRAWEAGLERILNPGIDLASSRAAVKLAESYPQVYVAVGVHPNSATSWRQGSLLQLRELAANPKVVAIGEIGLDYYRQRAPQDLQKQVFREQLALAAELNLPVVIHNRQATTDILEILIEFHARLETTNHSLVERPGVLHSYSGEVSLARQAIDLNFYIGITGPVTFRNASELQRTVPALPVDHLLVETDAPFLAPHPHRGQRNEPAYLHLVAEKIAELRCESFENIARVTTVNAARLFHW